jgi:hypothetical protein
MSKFVPKIKKQLVLAIQKLEVDKPCYVKFIDVVKEKEKIEKDAQGVETTGSIQIGHVTNLETGEELHIVMGSVLLSTLNEEYPNGGYVGLGFAVTKLPKKGTGARGYHPYLLAELDLT